MRHLTVLMALVLTASGCSSLPKRPNATQTTGQPVAVTINARQFDELRYVSPGAVVGQNAAYVAGALLLGGFITNMGSKGQFKGKPFGGILHPAQDYQRPLEQAAVQLLQQSPSQYDKTYQYPIKVETTEFRLIYDKLMSSQPKQYKLYFGVTATKRLEHRRQLKELYCSRVSDAFPLERWRANNYALAKQTTQEYGEACQQEFVSRLPELLRIS